MISKDTAAKIWGCHTEKEKCQKLLTDMKEAIQSTGKPDLQNAFGERRGLELGVPSGNNGHRLFNVPPALAFAIIEAHDKEQDRILEELKAIALIELKG